MVIRYFGIIIGFLTSQKFHTDSDAFPNFAKKCYGWIAILATHRQFSRSNHSVGAPESNRPEILIWQCSKLP